MSEKIGSKSESQTEHNSSDDNPAQDQSSSKKASAKKFSHEYVTMLDKHLSGGGSFVSFAGVVGVRNNDIYAWVEKFPEFAEVKAKYEKPRPRIY